MGIYYSPHGDGDGEKIYPVTFGGDGVRKFLPHEDRDGEALTLTIWIRV